MNSALRVAATDPALPMLAEQAARRFPQPVRVGALIGRTVLQPIESQPVLGRVEAITRRGEHGFDLIMHLGGVLGLGGRSIAVPIEGVALLGQYVAVVGFKPEQLRAFPTVANWSANAVEPNAIIEVGLVRPFH